MTDTRSLTEMLVPSRAPSARLVGNKRAVRLLLYALLLGLDCLAIIAAFVIADTVRGNEWLSPRGVNLGLLVTPLYVLMGFRSGAYSISSLRNLGDSIRHALSSLTLTMVAILLLSFFVHVGEEISRLAFGAALLGSAILIVTGRTVVQLSVFRAYNGILTDEILVVDGVRVAADGASHVVDARDENLEPDLQNPAMLNRMAMMLREYDRVVVACPPERQAAWSLVLKGLDVVGEIVMLNDNGLRAIGINRFGGRDTYVVARGRLGMANRAKKRLLDLAITVPAIIVLAPLFVVVSAAIVLENPGPVFFKQPRVGRGNRMFSILKFRSMRPDQCDSAGATSTARDDDRITRVGRFIRKTSIDELPQLINVLRSDMSLVGPRPHALGSLAGDKLFWQINEDYWLRHALKPGITGLAQIRGFRGATHVQKDLEDRLQADLEYVHGWRLWRDLTILFGTLGVLVHPNAY